MQYAPRVLHFSAFHILVVKVCFDCCCCSGSIKETIFIAREEGLLVTIYTPALWRVCVVLAWRTEATYETFWPMYS